jgi:hypothetical protein
MGRVDDLHSEWPDSMVAPTDLEVKKGLQEKKEEQRLWWVSEIGHGCFARGSGRYGKLTLYSPSTLFISGACFTSRQAHHTLKQRPGEFYLTILDRWQHCFA